MLKLGLQKMLANKSYLSYSPRMASGISTRYLGLLHTQPGGPSRLLARSCDATSSRLGFRGYATATVTKQKPPGPAKRTTRNAAVRSTSAASPKPSTQTVSAKTVPGSSKATGVVSDPAQPTGPATPGPVLTSGSTTYKVQEKSNQPLTEDEQMKQVDQILDMARLFPTADPWGQRVDTLDVIIPHPVNPATRRHFNSWREMLDQFWQNRLNNAKNATSMLLLAQADAIPGVDLSEAKIRHKFFTQWPWRVFTAASTRPSAWMSPFRGMALDTYKNLNTALAQQDDKGVKRLTASSYLETITGLLKRRQNPSLTYIWRFHKEVTPTRVLSIRATEGYLGTEDPKFGNRMMMHALVRFDTEQSLEIYDKRGNALHTPTSSSDAQASAQQSRRGTMLTCPAERKRVTEFLVLEKRMWYDGPWIIREQLWDIPGKKASV